MSLKAAVKEFLNTEGLYDGDLIYFGTAHSNQDKVMVLRDLGEHRLEPSRFRLFPALNIYIRDTADNFDALHSLSWDLFNAFDQFGPLQLTPTYRVSHVVPSGHPEDIGQDAAGNWQRTLSLNFALAPNLTI